MVNTTVRAWNLRSGHGSRIVFGVGPLAAISPSPFVVPHRRMILALRSRHASARTENSPTATHPRCSTTIRMSRLASPIFLFSFVALSVVLVAGDLRAAGGAVATTFRAVRGRVGVRDAAGWASPLFALLRAFWGNLD